MAAKSNETQSTPEFQQSTVPDGTSNLPLSLVDFPPPTSTGGVDSGPSSTAKKKVTP